jgi:SAM-dependent methyltransferase
MMSTRYMIRKLYAGEGIGRVQMNLALARTVHLSGLVLDVGGKGKPSYRELLPLSGSTRFVVLDRVADCTVDVAGAVELLPLRAAACDTLLCFNVLEHVFDYQAALAEMRRVLRPGGTLYGRVPFLLGVHADPSDHWRYTGDTLRRILADAGFDEVHVEAQGGLFLVFLNLSAPLLRFGLLRLAASGLAFALNRVFSAAIGGQRNRERFPMGYWFTAR